MKLSAHFFLQEFVPEEVYDYWKNNSRWFIDERIVTIAQAIRDKVKRAVIINNWEDGGDRDECGYRTPATTTGAKMSQHRWGRAIDILVPGYDLTQLYNYILRHQNEFPEITCMENVAKIKTWLHLDCRWTGQSNIVIVNP